MTFVPGDASEEAGADGEVVGEPRRADELSHLGAGWGLIGFIGTWLHQQPEDLCREQPVDGGEDEKERDEPEGRSANACDCCFEGLAVTDDGIDRAAQKHEAQREPGPPEPARAPRRSWLGRAHHYRTWWTACPE